MALARAAGNGKYKLGRPSGRPANQQIHLLALTRELLQLRPCTTCDSSSLSFRLVRGYDGADAIGRKGETEKLKRTEMDEAAAAAAWCLIFGAGAIY